VQQEYLILLGLAESVISPHFLEILLLLLRLLLSLLLQAKIEQSVMLNVQVSMQNVNWNLIQVETVQFSFGRV